MTFNKLLILFAAFTLFLTACSGGGNPAPNANSAANANTTAPVNSTNSAPVSNSAVATSTATPSSTTNDAPTVKPVVLAYYEALKTKNDEALRKVYSKQTLASLEADAKEEGKKSLVEFITELEPVPAQPYEVKNETIQGDVAVAEMFSPQYKNGIKIKFVKENGEWKLTNEIPDFEAVKKAAENSNTAK